MNTDASNTSARRPTLTIKNVPDELHERLKNQAERHRRSMSSEAIWILEQVLTPSRRSADAAIARARALHDRIGHTFDPNLIEQGKKEGRA